MKTAELTGAQLDYWVAKAEGHADITMGIESCFARIKHGGASTIKVFAPSSTWEQGGPIIEREEGGFYSRKDHPFPLMYVAQMGSGPARYQMSGPTQLVAAMRAYVGLKFGDEVPDE